MIYASPLWADLSKRRREPSPLVAFVAAGRLSPLPLLDPQCAACCANQHPGFRSSGLPLSALLSAGLWASAAAMMMALTELALLSTLAASNALRPAVVAG